GSVASVTGFGASLLATLILGAVLGQGPADEGELGLRFYQAVDSGLASALINPWFVALVLATRAFDRRVEQFAVIAALSSVVATTAGSVLLRHPVPIVLWWTAGLMVGAALSAAYVARRGPELKSTAVAVGVVAIALASAQGNPVSVLLVTV